MRKAALQVLFWFVFFLGWQRVVYGYVDNTTNRLAFTAFDVGQIMLVFYLTYLLITPHLFPRKNKLPFLVTMLATVLLAGGLLIYIMQYFLHHQVMPIRFNFTWNYSDLVANRYIIALLGALAGFIGKLFIEWFQAKRKIEEAEKLRVAAELTYLKTQVNPHFLFNAINTVYIQIDESTEAAKHTLSSFADMLRYQLYECNHDKVPIEKEVEYLQHYIELQKMRLDERYEIDFHFDESLRGFTIAPFLLIPVIENMFKHVSDTVTQPVIKGALNYSNEQLTFHGANTTEQHSTATHTGGIGLANLKRRLTLIYPERHTLTIKDSGNKYEVWLTLQPI
jgi:two-component system, LytTR family, sensor kinase